MGSLYSTCQRGDQTEIGGVARGGAYNKSIKFQFESLQDALGDFSEKSANPLSIVDSTGTEGKKLAVVDFVFLKVHIGRFGRSKMIRCLDRALLERLY